MALASRFLPLKVKAVLRAMTKLLWRRDSSVVRFSVTKYSWAGSLERLVKGSTRMDSRAASAGGCEAKATGRFALRNHHAPPPIRTSNAASAATSGMSAERFFGAGGRVGIAGFACAGTPTRSE